MPSLPRIALLLGLAVIGAYAFIIAWFKLNEDRLVFHPDPDAYGDPPDSLGRVHRVRLTTADSTSIAAWAIVPPATVPADSAPWLLYCHGNGGNLGNAGYHEAWVMLRSLGLGILAMDYRGYGESGGAPSEAGLYRDAEAAYAYLRDSVGVPPHRIIFYGFSLGSAVAADLASRLPAAALVMEGSLLSVPDRGQELYPFLPVHIMARNRFATIDKIGRVAHPKLFIHSREDEVNPFSHGVRLHELARDPKEFLEVSGGHATAYKLDGRFMPGIARFLAGLGFPHPHPLARSGPE